MKHLRSITKPKRCEARTETQTGVWVCIRPEHSNNQPKRHSFVKEERARG